MFSRPLLLGRMAPIIASRALYSVSSADKVQLPRQHKWNRTVSAAERLVGFPTSLFHLRTLLADDVTSMSDHLRRLMGSDHPVLRALKRLVIHGGQNNVQVRGLMMLLFARAVNDASPGIVGKDEDMDPSTGILVRQRKLAEIVEMIAAAQVIHKSVLNLPDELPVGADADATDDLHQLEYGNKIAILGGDYLLANACVSLAELRNTYIVHMMAVAIGEFTQSEFLGHRDSQGRLIPNKDTISLEAWLQRNKMATGKLVANGYRGVMMLGNQTEAVKDMAERVGRNIALALQAFTELQPFVDETQHDFVLDLSAAPVLFHLQNDPELLAYIHSCDGNLERLDSRQIFAKVAAGPGVQMTQELCRTHAAESLKDTQEQLQDGEAKSALESLVTYLKH